MPILGSPDSTANKDTMSTIWTNGDTILSHNNPCFQCNIAITNFLVPNTCEIRFHDVIYRTVRIFTSRGHSTQKFQNMAK